MMRSAQLHILFLSFVFVFLASGCRTMQSGSNYDFIDDVYFIPYEPSAMQDMTPRFNKRAKELIFVTDEEVSEQ